jgi:hypothetical protein
MNLVQIVKFIESIALKHPLVKSFYEGNVCEHLNSKEVKYGAFVLTQQDFNSVVKDDNVKKYTFQAAYIDRLTEDESNKLVIQTDGINVIHEVFNYIKTNAQTADIETPITFTTFTQKFADKCGGAFAVVTIEVDDELGSCDFYYENILIDPIPGTSHTTVLDNYYTKVEVEDLLRNITHDSLRDLNGNPNFLHINEEQKALIISTAEIVSGNTEDISNLQTNKADKATTLGGYGITDAYTQAEIDTKLNNTRTYKILDTVVSTWSASTTYTKYPYEAVILIENIKESDSVEVIYNIIDAGSANYAPGGELYEGYIKIFSKVNTEITIPTLVITKIDL